MNFHLNRFGFIFLIVLSLGLILIVFLTDWKIVSDPESNIEHVEKKEHGRRISRVPNTVDREVDYMVRAHHEFMGNGSKSPLLLEIENLKQGDDYVEFWRRIGDEDCKRIQKDFFKASFLSRLVMIGETGEAINLVQTELGAGLERDSAISSIFTSLFMVSEGSQYQIPAMLELVKSNPRDLKVALTAIGSQLASKKMKAEELDLFLTGNLENDQALAGAFMAEAFSLATLQGSPEAKRSQLQEAVVSLEVLIERGLITRSAGITALLDASSTDPFLYLETAIDLAENTDQLRLSSELRKSIVLMVAEDPSSAMRFFTDEKLHDLAPRFAPEAMKTWIKIDSEAASKWLTSIGNELPPDVFDAMAGEVVKSDLREGNLPGAREWAEKMTVAPLRSQAESKIWESERRAVFAEVAENPEAFLGSIATGQTQHEEYWMKEGFKKWFSTSSAEANQWFEDNKETLSPPQSQHIARAYAEIALEQGDIGLAREWSARVVDPEFKQKLVDQIEAKDQEGGE